MQNYGQDFINHISPLMGGPLCDNKIWHLYIINVTETRMIWVSFYSEFGLSGIDFFLKFINFRPGRDFINGRGLLIQGGDYIYIYIYIYVHRRLVV